MNNTKRVVALFMVIIFLLAGCNPSQNNKMPDTQTPAATSTSTISPTPSSTPTPTATNTPSPTPTLTPTLIGGYPGRYLVDYQTNENQLVSLFNADGELIKNIFTFPADTTGYVNAKWSPNGKAFAVTYDTDNGYISLFNSDGQEIKKITTGVASEINWSPDGQWLVFSSKGENTYVDVYKIEGNGENLQQLTNTYGKDLGPVFLPKGNDIQYYSVATEGGQIIDTNGENLRYTVYSYAWSSDEEYYLTDFPTMKTVKMVNWRTKEKKVIFTTSGHDWWIGDYFFSPDEKYVFVGEYNSWHDRPNKLYRVNVEDPGTPILIANGYGLRLSYDKKLILFSGWLASEGMIGDYKDYAMSLDGSTWWPVKKNFFGMMYGNWQPGSIPMTSIDPLSFIGPTPIPSWTPFPGSPVFEEFSTEELDQTKWETPMIAKPANFPWKIYQETLNIQSNGKIQNEGADFNLNTSRKISDLNTFEAKTKIWVGSYGTAYATVSIHAKLLRSNWQAQCKTGRFADELLFKCEVQTLVNGKKNLEFSTKSVNIQPSEWYDVRIEFSPEYGAIQFYLDGELIATYLPNDAEEIKKGIELQPEVGVWCEDGVINASFDDIRLGK